MERAHPRRADDSLTGTAFLGSVEVKVVNPNAPSWIQTLRTRWNEARGISSGER